MKLELKHLAPYLPYGLKAINTFKEKVEVLGIQNGNESVSNVIWVFRHSNRDYLRGYLYDCKPILRPLSDLTKEIEVNGEKFVPYDYFYDDPENDWFDGNVWMNYMFEGNIEKTDINFIPYYITQKLLEWHFDVFGLIENGLAIDINNLKE